LRSQRSLSRPGKKKPSPRALLLSSHHRSFLVVLSLAQPPSPLQRPTRLQLRCLHSRRSKLQSQVSQKRRLCRHRLSNRHPLWLQILLRPRYHLSRLPRRRPHSIRLSLPQNQHRSRRLPYSLVCQLLLLRILLRLRCRFSHLPRRHPHPSRLDLPQNLPWGRNLPYSLQYQLLLLQLSGSPLLRPLTPRSSPSLLPRNQPLYSTSHLLHLPPVPIKFLPQPGRHWIPAKSRLVSSAP